MGHDKLRKFAELNTFPNVLQNFDYHNPSLINNEGNPVKLKGKWNQSFFKNDNPIILELACGKGEYTLGLSALFSEKNFIGIDLKGNRIWNGAKRALQEKKDNVAFLRTKIELITNFFAQDEVSEIWITFADPFVNPTDANRRLTSPYFLEKYREICKKEAVVHLKTDDAILFNYTCKVVKEGGYKILECEEDIYRNGEVIPSLAIKTNYEKQHLERGRTIKYLAFEL